MKNVTFYHKGIKLYLEYIFTDELFEINEVLYTDKNCNWRVDLLKAVTIEVLKPKKIDATNRSKPQQFLKGVDRCRLTCDLVNKEGEYIDITIYLKILEKRKLIDVESLNPLRSK